MHTPCVHDFVVVNADVVSLKNLEKELRATLVRHVKGEK